MIWRALIVALLSLSRVSFAETRYKGESLNCTGLNETVLVDVHNAVVTRNGVVYKALEVQSFAFYYFLIYDTTTGLEQDWTVEVFTVADASGPGNAFLTHADGQPGIPISCVPAP